MATIQGQLLLLNTYNEKINYLAGVMQNVFEATANLRSAYIDLAKVVHGGFLVICECGKTYETDVTVCECGSHQLHYAFGRRREQDKKDEVTLETAKVVQGNEEKIPQSEGAPGPSCGCDHSNF